MIHHPCLLHNGAALIKHSEVWDATDVESRRQLGVALGIHLNDDGPARHVRSRTRHLGRRHVARTAPFCPEICKYRNARALHDFVELFRIDLERLVCRRERSLARAAPAGIGKVLSGNTVPALTCFACPNNTHSHLSSAGSEGRGESDVTGSQYGCTALSRCRAPSPKTPAVEDVSSTL